MADAKVTLNPGVDGQEVAVDRHASDGDFQYVKACFGASDTQTRVTDADGARLPIKPHMAGTGTRTQVSDSATDVQLLAANANRKGAVIANDSSAILYLGLGTTTVTSTNYTAKVYQDAVYEVPPCFTGEIRGIWATDPNDGGARVTELT